MSRPRPYPLTPLAAALGLDPTDTAGLALAVGVDRSWIKRYRHLGLTEAQADRWAARTGLHPLDVWPLWGSYTGLFAVNAHKTHCPEGHPYDRVDAAGFRRCSICIREATARYKKSTKPQVTVLMTRAPHLVETLPIMKSPGTRRVRVNSLVPADTHQQITELAHVAGLSVSAWVCMTLTAAIRDQQHQEEPAA